MTDTFDPTVPQIVLQGFLSGPGRTTRVRLAVDTGASGTVISRSILTALGIPIPPTARRRRLRGVTGIAPAPVVSVRQLLVLGHAVEHFPVAAHDLPLGTACDGLLGLDFFRGMVLNLDFARGRITLKPPRWWRLW